MPSPIFKARYKGTCAKCAKEVQPGDFVSWARRAGQRGIVYHAQCMGYTPSAANEAPNAATQALVAEANDTSSSKPPATDAQAVRDIAREVAQEEDARMLGALIGAVESRLAANLPTTCTVSIPSANGDAPATTTLDNVHHALPKAVYLASRKQHVYLYGPPGSGKSTGGFQVAKLLGRSSGYCSLNPQTPESRLLGYLDAGGMYRETEFFRRYTDGGVFIIDELDNAHPALLNTLNGMLESDETGVGRGAFPCGVVERHKDFVCIATGNTNGRGGDKLFPERRALDSAFLERFTFIYWDYDNALEQAITLSINKDAAPWLAWCRNVRGFVKQHQIRLWVSPRAAFKGAAMLKDSGWSLDEIADAVVFKGLDIDTVQRITSAVPLPKLVGEE